jgi:cell division protein FtsB
MNNKPMIAQRYSLVFALVALALFGLLSINGTNTAQDVFQYLVNTP